MTSVDGLSLSLTLLIYKYGRIKLILSWRLELAHADSLQHPSGSAK
jgi:hypothetical protein